MRYASIKNYDIANGQGVRVSLFVTGCRHHCPNCFNEEIWEFDTGEAFTDKEKDMILSYLEPDYIEGLSLLGGEPLEPENQQGLLNLVKEVREKYPNKSIWCYTGFTFEYLIEQKLNKDPYLKELLENIDILVDGPFVEDLKNPSLAFRGSSNQRILDCMQSINNMKPCELHMDRLGQTKKSD